MITIIIRNPTLYNNTIKYELKINNDYHTIFFEYNIDEEVCINPEGLVSVFYCIAKYNNINLIVEPELDKHFCDTIYNIDTEIYRFKKPYTSSITFKNINKTKEKIQKPIKSICSMTGGVDSIYSCIKHNPDNFLYIIGCDINYNLSYSSWINKNINYIKDIINQNFIKKKLVIMKTNLIIFMKDLMKKYDIDTEFTYLTNGFILYSCAINLKNYNKIILPGPGFGYGKYLENISHICYTKFNNVGSTSFFDIQQCDAPRIDKIKYINNSNNKLLKTLRVCINYGNVSTLNCLKCQKCIRTSIILNLLKVQHNLIEYTTEELDKYINNLINTEKNWKYYLKSFNTQLIDLYFTCNSNDKYNNTWSKK